MCMIPVCSYIEKNLSHTSWKFQDIYPWEFHLLLCLKITFLYFAGHTKWYISTNTLCDLWIYLLKSLFPLLFIPFYYILLIAAELRGIKPYVIKCSTILETVERVSLVILEISAREIGPLSLIKFKMRERFIFWTNLKFPVLVYNILYPFYKNIIVCSLNIQLNFITTSWECQIKFMCCALCI